MNKIREHYYEGGTLYLKCGGCGKFKEATSKFFAPDKTGFMHLRYKCKKCDTDYAREYRREHKDRINEMAKKYAASPSRKEACKIWASEHKDIVRESGRRYREKNRDKIKEGLRIKENTIFNKVHTKTRRVISKLKIRPSECSICGRQTTIYAHHTDYNKRNEVVFVCPSCHNLIHNGELDCPKPIDLLKISS